MYQKDGGVTMTDYQRWKQQYNKRLIAKYSKPVTQPKPQPVVQPKPQPVVQTQPQTVRPKPKSKVPQYKQILNKTVNQVNKMKKQELQESVKILARQANTRLTKLGKQGYNTDWYDTLNGHVTPSTDYSQLRKQFSKLSQFLQSDMSTVQGVEKHNIKVAKILGVDTKYLTKSNFDKIGSINNKLLELQKLGQLPADLDSDQVMSDIGDYITSDMTVDQIVDQISSLVEKRYIEEQERLSNWSV